MNPVVTVVLTLLVLLPALAVAAPLPERSVEADCIVEFGPSADPNNRSIGQLTVLGIGDVRFIDVGSGTTFLLKGKPVDVATMEEWKARGTIYFRGAVRYRPSPREAAIDVLSWEWK